MYHPLPANSPLKIIQPASPVESFSAIPGTYCVTLSWSEAVEETVTGYRIYRKTEDSEFALLTTISSRDTLSYVDNSLTAGTEYIYCITAMQGDVEGEWSDEITAVPDIDREAPVLTSLTPASYSTLSKTVTITASATDNIEVVRYEASYSADDGATWQTVAAAAGKTCRMSLDTTKISDGVVLFRVLAFDAQGNSGGSNRIYTYKIDNTGPAKVEGLETVVVYPTQMTISWERPLDEDTDHFVLQQKTGDTLTTVSSKIQTLGYNLSGLSPKTKYQYRVMAVDAYGNEGEYSDWLTVTTPADTSAPVVTAQSQNSGAYNTDVTYSATIVDDYAVASVSIQYSTDKTNWTQLDSFDFATDQKKVGITKNIDLTAFNEGSLYIRAVGTDRFGNVGDETTSAPFVEYLVDRTAPDCVRNVSATVSDKTVIVRWEAVSASDVASYSLYRSTSAGDNYFCIAQNIKKLSYSDSGVERNQTYYYKVLAVDNADNSSALSEFCSASVYSDVIAPIIGSVSPNGGTIGPVNKTVSIAVSDNDMLMKLSVACKQSGDEDYVALQDFDLSGSSQTISLDLPLDEYTNGEAVQLRIVCTDKAGLVSSPAYIDYIIDKEAPNVADVNITGKEGSATITWADCGESDLSGFEIYRCDSANTLVGKRAVNTSGVYTMTDYVTQQLVRYRIDAVDKYGNRNSVFTDEVSTQIVLKPSITLPEKLTAETELVFSAENSISAFGIASYSWEFDDGATDSGEKIVRTFENAGSFILTLTVTDIKGNTASVSKNFVVQEYSRTGILKVRVLSDSGNAIRNCGVYIDLGSSSQRVLHTSSSGVLTTEVPVGVHEIGAYCDGYLPKSATVAVSADNTSEISFELTEQNIVTGDFEVHEMNFQEIVAAGIDVSDPANQQIYKVNVTLIYGDDEVPVTYIRSATEIKEYVIRDSDTSSPQTNYKYDIKYIPNDGNEEIIAVVRLPIRASYLKQFFMATLTIFNNADSDYRLVDCSASIPVPAGLTVMSQSAIDSVIPGGSSARYTLVLRGDTPGTYTLTANFNGTLEKFNKSVNASFTSNSFRVYDKSDVAIVVEIPKQTVGQFRFNIGIENRRGAAIYSPQIDIDGMVQDITTMFKKSLQEDVEYEEGDIKDLKFEGIGSFVRNADGSATTYDSCSIPVDTLESGCGVFLEYQTIDMPADGAEGWFSKAVIECEDGFGGYVEVRFLEDSTVPISEDEYIEEHLNFASSSDYAIASFDFAGYMHDAVKDSKEYAELNIIDWSLSDVTDEAFNKLNDEIAADYIAQILNSATDEKKVELKFMKTFSEIVDHLSDMLIADEDLGNKELVKNKIDKMLEGTDYDSSTNELLQQMLGKYMSTETLNDIYGVYDTVDNLSSIYHCAADEVEGIKRLTTYVAAIAAYQDVEEEIKQNLLNTAEKMENSRMKTALLRYANTAIDEESYKSELRNMAIHNYIGNVYTFLKFSYSSVIEKTIKKVTVNVLDKILPLADASSISSDLSVSVGWISAGREVLSALSSADKQREALKILIRLADATAASGAVLADAKADLEANRDIASAKAFDTAFKLYKHWQLMAYSAFEDYGNALTDNFIAKHIAKKSREEHLSALADVIAQENRLKGIYCHTKGHELDSDGVKVLAVACPVDVKLYSPQGVLAAQIVSGTADVYDELVSCFVFGEEKLFAVPSGLDYQIEITATGPGTMDYTVFEYSDGTEKREISFPEQAIEVDDNFCGSTGILVEEDTETYSLLKNGSDAVITDGQTVIRTTGVTLNEDAVILDKGNTFALHAQVQPDGTSDVKWKSSDESVCTVDSNGKLTAISCGEAVIYAISLDGGYVDTAAVTVNEHTFDDGVVTVAATCTADGVRTFTCTSCGETRTEIISASGHNWSEWAVVYAADCENTGLEQRLCLNNKTHVETRETAKTDHVDFDADGHCDICDADVSTENSPEEQTPNCVCGENHTGLFAWLVKFFHRIYYFFKHLFGSN